MVWTLSNPNNPFSFRFGGLDFVQSPNPKSPNLPWSKSKLAKQSFDFPPGRIDSVKLYKPAVVENIVFTPGRIDFVKPCVLELDGVQNSPARIPEGKPALVWFPLETIPGQFSTKSKPAVGCVDLLTMPTLRGLVLGLRPNNPPASLKTKRNVSFQELNSSGFLIIYLTMRGGSRKKIAKKIIPKVPTRRNV